MVAKVGEVFMNIRTVKLVSLVFVLLLSCSEDLSDDPIPYQPFPDIIINLNLPEYLALRSNGGSVNVNDGGIRGILIHRISASTYYAFERSCSYHPNDACATIGVDVSQLFLIDTCCGSTFDFNGNPTGGPAWRQLRRYATILDGSELTITDEIVE
jgi:hypothetical protein